MLLPVLEAEAASPCRWPTRHGGSRGGFEPPSTLRVAPCGTHLLPRPADSLTGCTKLHPGPGFTIRSAAQSVKPAAPSAWSSVVASFMLHWRDVTLPQCRVLRRRKVEIVSRRRPLDLRIRDARPPGSCINAGKTRWPPYEIGRGIYGASTIRSGQVLGLCPVMLRRRSWLPAWRSSRCRPYRTSCQIGRFAVRRDTYEKPKWSRETAKSGWPSISVT